MKRKSLLRRAVFAMALAFMVAGFGGIETLFAPKAELWDRWTDFDDAESATVDHAAWDAFLAAYVAPDGQGVNRVAYGRVRADAGQALDAYIGRLIAMSVTSLNRAEQRAYWINLYNALTVKLILAHYPVTSIRDIDISPGLFSVGPWDRKLVAVEGEPVSLNDIEHRILRPIWRDPRIHYALNCAAVGCPNLLNRAFTAGNTEALLDAAARAYVNDPRGVRIEDDRVTVSSIYAWFIEDFGGDEAGVIAHLRRYADPPRAAALSRAESLEDAYDWTLNDAR